MIDCVSAENMRLSDAYTVTNFVSGRELMHRAAYGVYKAVQRHNQTAIVVDSENNGGDGFALACILKKHGFACTMFTVSQLFSEDSTHYADLGKVVGVPILAFDHNCLEGYSIVVDCLLGTRLHGHVRDSYRISIESINASAAFIVSVDINSGMNCDTGEAEVSVKSDLTVTNGYVKAGLISENAGKYMKRLVCRDIGIALAKEERKICTEEEWLTSGCFL